MSKNLKQKWVNRYKMVAHRGLHDEIIPENSLLSFKKALEYKLPIELDVSLISDNNIVVFHDKNLKRMTTYDKDVVDTKYDEIKCLKLSKSNERIPLLEEVLQLVDGKVPIIIELKYSYQKNALARRLIKILSYYKGEVLLMSFDYRVLYYLKCHCSHPIGLITLSLKKRGINLDIIKQLGIYILSIIPSLNLDFLVCELEEFPSNLLKKYRTLGYLLFVWGIKNQADLNIAQQYGDIFLLDFKY